MRLERDALRSMLVVRLLVRSHARQEQNPNIIYQSYPGKNMGVIFITVLVKFRKKISGNLHGVVFRKTYVIGQCGTRLWCRAHVTCSE